MEQQIEQGGEVKKTSWKMKVAKIVVGTILFIVAFLIVVSIIRAPGYFDKQKTDEQVVKIHATKLTLDDVMGKNLPPDPGAEADKTIAGIDANKNGIRDDVELAIFKQYPDSAKTRAVLLQYALALQMEVTQPIVNEGTVGEVANKEDRAIFCIANLIAPEGEGRVLTVMQKYVAPLSKEQFNTETRTISHKKFYSYLKSGRIDDSISCDIELTLLPN